MLVLVSCSTSSSVQPFIATTTLPRQATSLAALGNKRACVSVTTGVCNGCYSGYTLDGYEVVVVGRLHRETNSIRTRSTRENAIMFISFCRSSSIYHHCQSLSLFSAVPNIWVENATVRQAALRTNVRSLCGDWHFPLRVLRRLKIRNGVPRVAVEEHSSSIRLSLLLWLLCVCSHPSLHRGFASSITTTIVARATRGTTTSVTVPASRAR